MSQANCDLMQNWASSFGAAVRQRTVHQETTTAKHGTLPKFMYQRRCVISEESVELTTLPSGQNTEESMLDQLNEEVNDEEIADEFDPNSDEEVEGEEADGGEIGSSATFLLGARSRFGRAVRFNNRFLS